MKLSLLAQKKFNQKFLESGLNSPGFSLDKQERADFITAGIMPIINAIEVEVDPSVIYNDYGLKELIKGFKKMKADYLLLGCTHLPYIKNEIKIKFEKIIDPAAEISNMITKLNN